MKPLAQLAYEAYTDCHQGQCPISGLPLPSWDRQNPDARRSWEHIAHIVRTYVLQQQRLESFSRQTDDSLDPS